jgi:hypothetical protein
VPRALHGSQAMAARRPPLHTRALVRLAGATQIGRCHQPTLTDEPQLMASRSSVPCTTSFESARDRRQRGLVDTVSSERFQQRPATGAVSSSATPRQRGKRLTRPWLADPSRRQQPRQGLARGTDASAACPCVQRCGQTGFGVVRKARSTHLGKQRA